VREERREMGVKAAVVVSRKRRVDGWKFIVLLRLGGCG
jgi:hypothetical protein